MSNFNEWKSRVDKMTESQVQRLYINLPLLEDNYSKKVMYLQSILFNNYIGDIQKVHKK